jgi:hypothetical protein
MFDDVAKVGILVGKLVRKDMNEAGHAVGYFAIDFVLAPNKEVTSEFTSQPVDTPKTLR